MPQATLLQPLGLGQGYVKAGFFGFGKSGKTYTATLLGIALKQYLGSAGKIAMFDTENGSTYIAPVVKDLTDQDLLGVRSRAFDDLMKVAKETESMGVEVLIVDSITHVWMELQEAHIAAVNAQRKKRGWSARQGLEFQDWGPIKRKWAEWTAWFLNSSCHVIVCGRAGWEYDYDKNQETGKKELQKTGTKLKAENEFTFEPSLLCEFERHERDGKASRRVFVHGDRFRALDGHSTEFVGGENTSEDLAAVYDFFRPHLDCLSEGANPTVDVATKTKQQVDAFGGAEMSRKRDILCEEIKGQLLRLHHSNSADDRRARQDLMEEIYGTRSWKKLETLEFSVLEVGLEHLKTLGVEVPADAEPAAEEVSP